MISKGQIEYTGQLTAIIGSDQTSPVIPNLSIAARYGLSDRCNLGLTFHPGFLVADYLIGIEPFGVCNVVKRSPYIPEVNAYAVFPMFISIKYKGIKVIPELGLCLNYKNKKWSPFILSEASFDHKVITQEIQAHVNIRLGMYHPINPRWSMSIEGGINDIGTVGLVTNSTMGYPVIYLGIFYLPTLPEKLK